MRFHMVETYVKTVRDLISNINNLLPFPPNAHLLNSSKLHIIQHYAQLSIKGITNLQNAWANGKIFTEKILQEKVRLEESDQVF